MPVCARPVALTLHALNLRLLVMRRQWWCTSPVWSVRRRLQQPLQKAAWRAALGRTAVLGRRGSAIHCLAQPLLARYANSAPYTVKSNIAIRPSRSTLRRNRRATQRGILAWETILPVLHLFLQCDSQSLSSATRVHKQTAGIQYIIRACIPLMTCRGQDT